MDIKNLAAILYKDNFGVRMPVVADRSHVLEILRRFEEAGAVMPVICYDGREDMEGALIGVKRYAEEHGIKDPPLALSITYGYPEMSQAARVWRCRNKKAGLKASFSDMDILCGPDGPYSDILVLPHLDHADAEKEERVWREFSDHLATVLVDGSLGDRTLDENIRLTARAVERYGKKLVIEGCLQRPAVEGVHGAEALAGADTPRQYAGMARDYVRRTGVDLVVVELGSSQQAVGWASYKPQIARAVTKALGGRHMLVLHGGSSVKPEAMATMGADGIVRFNMWTRMAYEAAQAGAKAVLRDAQYVFTGDRPPNAPHQQYRTRYSDAYVDHAAAVVGEILKAQNYRKLAEV